MLKERILIIFLALITGLLFSVGAFYLYQKGKAMTPNSVSQNTNPTTPEVSPTLSLLLEVTSPQNEEVVAQKIVQVAGRTSNLATVVILLEDKEQVLAPAADGTFATNINLTDGVNVIEVMAFLPDGKMLSEKRTITYTTEN
ncbi:hypothetical protein HYW66_02370, partial [Candidatus Microgenomates bacterium]|nr:hypothetical protein [Candidatus Microgenomates bacterium]